MLLTEHAEAGTHRWVYVVYIVIHEESFLKLY